MYYLVHDFYINRRDEGSLTDIDLEENTRSPDYLTQKFVSSVLQNLYSSGCEKSIFIDVLQVLIEPFNIQISSFKYQSHYYFS